MPEPDVQALADELTVLRAQFDALKPDSALEDRRSRRHLLGGLAGLVAAGAVGVAAAQPAAAADGDPILALASRPSVDDGHPMCPVLPWQAESAGSAPLSHVDPRAGHAKKSHAMSDGTCLHVADVRVGLRGVGRSGYQMPVIACADSAIRQAITQTPPMAT